MEGVKKKKNYCGHCTSLKVAVYNWTLYSNP